MAIKAVLFDLDDTLLWDDRSVHEAFEATARLAADRYGVHIHSVVEAVRAEARKLYEGYETYDFTRMIGINPFEGLWGNFTEGGHPSFRALQKLVPDYRRDAWTAGLRAVGIEDPELGALLGERFPAERRQRPIVYEETYRILDELKGKYRLLLLTNGSPDLQKEKLAAVPQLPGYFDEIVISGDFGEGKPSGNLFRFAMDKLGITAEQGVMVGDKLTTDIAGALGIGMTSVWINRDGKVKDPNIVPDYEIGHLSELLTLLEKI